LDIREAILKAKEVFLKIGDPNEEVARRSASEFRSLMDEWGITLDNMQRLTGKKWRPLAHRAVEIWRKSGVTRKDVEPKFRRPRRERKAWLLWKEVAEALEMISVLNLREPREDDTYYREVYERSSRELKRLVEAGYYPRDLNDERDFQHWRAEWDCW
jgi:hypothetical protein